MEKAIINENSYIDGSIICWRSKIGKWARVEGLSIVGEEVVISDEVLVNCIIILPNVNVKTSSLNPGNVVLF